MINLFATFNKIDGLNIGDNVMITPENKSSNLISEKFCIQDGIIVIPKNTTIESNTII